MTSNSQIPVSINGPLYFLYHIIDVGSEEPYAKLVQHLKKAYSEDQLKSFLDGVEWMLANPDINFENVLPGLKKTQKEILTFCYRMQNILTSLLVKRK